MNPMRPLSAKIIQHAEGLGAPTPETVRQRAREIAMIDGRNEFTEDDWRAAKRELHGGHESNDTNGEHDMTVAISEHDMVVGSLGHHTPKLMPEDSESMAEELIAEGFDEAIHEQMIAARREEPTDDDER